MINQYRIGNIMQDSLTGELLRISELTETNVVTTVIDRSKYPLPDGWQMVPIRLTPEVLVKCGFKPEGPDYEGYYTLQILPNYELRVLSKKEYSTTSSGYPGAIVDDHKFKHIQYLHQLQNLYYSWLGKELTYAP